VDQRGVGIADEAVPHELRCACGGQAFDVAVGFARRKDAEVRWVSIGIIVEGRRARLPGDWKINYGWHAPTRICIW
jgi:hypothetical protein